jgi:hypothetical protein
MKLLLATMFAASLAFLAAGVALVWKGLRWTP